MPPYLTGIEGPPPKRNVVRSSRAGGAINAVNTKVCGIFLLCRPVGSADKEAGASRPDLLIWTRSVFCSLPRISGYLLRGRFSTLKRLSR